MLNKLFDPESIAVIGAAHSDRKLGGIVLKNLLQFSGKVYPVNPKYSELMGMKAYPSVAEIDSAIDLAIIMRPASEVVELLKQLKGKTKIVIVVTSGFSEVGAYQLQNEVKEAGKEAGVRILGPNCMGLYNPYAGVDTFFLPTDRLLRPGKGNVAMVSQSGAVISCLMSAMKSANMGVSKAVTYGNAVDIDESDLFEYLAEDVQTDVVISYIESVGDGRKFIDRARMVSERKPLIILKAGKSQRGQTAAFSHTGRLAGRYEVFRSILKQYGIREAANMDDFLDSAKAVSYQRPSRGSRIVIVTNGGGSGVLATDECMRQDLNVLKLPEQKAGELKEMFPPFYGINNPVDLTAQVTDEDYLIVLNKLKDDYDGFLIIALPNVLGITERLAPLLAEFKDSVKKPVVAHVAESGITAKLVSLLELAKVPVYPSPERAVRALKALLD